MKQSLAREHRRTLENQVARARAEAEAGAVKALNALAVAAREMPAHLSSEQQQLRVRLRAHGRALGDLRRPDETQGIDHLVAEIAYEHWHRMLFARFLAESDLLMHPDGYPVSLQDCKEDAASLTPPARSEWEVAGRYASRMLPNVFRPDSPALALQLPLETEQALEALLARLPAAVFEADDSLGWSYQFWQAPKKDEVQRQMKQAGTKVGADELPAVTQLFTEHYMVAFLLENSLGAWWKIRHPLLTLPVEMPYLRFAPSPDKGRAGEGFPAAGTFPAWPETLADFRLLDPCLGSGHFLVSALYYLVPMRQAAERLSVRDAVDKVLAENLHGLELDARCVEIAAFALAFAAWRYPDETGQLLGFRPLPRLNIACCGLAPRSKKADWLKLADGDDRLENGMAALYSLFQQAPELGSLLDPSAATRGDLIDANWSELEALMEKALASSSDDDAQNEARVAAQGMALATRILTRRYHLVITNPPYLGAGQHGPVLKDFCETHYKTAKGDLANVFLERSLKLCVPGGTVSFVMPQNWLFLKSYQKQREHLLNFATWNLLARLGSRAFETITGEVVNAILLTLTNAKPAEDQMLHGLDASVPKSPEEKASLMVIGQLLVVRQNSQLSNPDARVALEQSSGLALLNKYSNSYQGITTGDNPRFITFFWEVQGWNQAWKSFQSTGDISDYFVGREQVFRWENGNGVLATSAAARIQGQVAWESKGVAVRQMSNLPATLNSGSPWDMNSAMLVPINPAHLPAIWCFCSSPEYNETVRRVDQALKVTNATLGQIPFDLAHWQQVAAERYPNGLPKPYSDDPTQWIFHGHPKPASDPLQVALARLLGYRWPAESALSPGPQLCTPLTSPGGRGENAMELSAEAHAWIARCTALADLSDDDGILCLPAVRGESAGVDRLRALLSRAFGADWSAAREAQLLKEAGCEAMPLEQWLRDKFFEQHVARFQKRPFIWHLWDGHKEGFSALVNTHQFTREKLNTLIHLYLGDWITQQKRAVDSADTQGDAVLKLAKAEVLKARLEAILEGEPPYDIFVRWKPLHQQPLGWDPDINDGVRLNIRPFVAAEVLRIPRAKLGIKWEADRGKDVPSAPWFNLGPQYGEPAGTRINDHHTTLVEKATAREKSR